MTYSIEDSSRFRDLLKALVSQHCPFPVDIYFVPDIAQHFGSSANGLTGSPVGVAVRSDTTGAAEIYVRTSIDPARVQSVLDRIDMGTGVESSELISTTELFMRHLVLHELAHLVNDWGQEREDDCNSWAFQRLCTAVQLFNEGGPRSFRFCSPYLRR